MNAYALYRRSTTAQDLSIEEQRAAVRAWADEHGYQIVREFQDDASGLDLARRQEFQALLRVGEASTVVNETAGRLPPHRPERAELPHSVRQARLPAPAQG